MQALLVAVATMLPGDVTAKHAVIGFKYRHLHRDIVEMDKARDEQGGWHLIRRCRSWGGMKRFPAGTTFRVLGRDETTGGALLRPVGQSGEWWVAKSHFSKPSVFAKSVRQMTERQFTLSGLRAGPTVIVPPPPTAEQKKQRQAEQIRLDRIKKRKAAAAARRLARQRRLRS